MHPISATLITYNEEQNIAGALESLYWVDEIVVVDSGSVDKTLDICRRFTDKIFQRDWTGYVDQKNFAVEKALHDWILSLDADERVSPELRIEIEALASSEIRCSGYRIPRVAYFMGRWIRHGIWWRDTIDSGSPTAVAEKIERSVPVLELMSVSCSDDISSSGSGMREISRSDVDEIFREAENKHLVTRPFRNDKDRSRTDGICFCCDDCCCYFLDPTDACDRGDLVESTDIEECLNCGACEDVCYFGARKMKEGELIIDRESCYGCGLCVDVCPYDCVVMVPLG